MKNEYLSSTSKRSIAKCGWIIIGLILCGVGIFALHSYVTREISRGKRAGIIGHQVHTIAVGLTEYKKDHGGRFPKGNTSTEIFQTLLDEKYFSNPEIFYLPMPGKVSPNGSQLRSDNVALDLTYGVDTYVPDFMPFVYITGYRVTYQPGTTAIPIKSLAAQSVFDDWFGFNFWSFIAVAYVNNGSRIIEADKDGTIPNFVPADFDPKGKVYRQLTP